MKAIRIQRRMGVSRPEPESASAIRVSHRAARKRRQVRISPRYLLRCGCCGQSVEIYYDTDGLEINGVNGSLENWREILLPLLGIKQPKKERRTEAAAGRKRM
jgi:hypothetical protein